ncbi:MAG: histidine phosphatase family protein [Bacteroidota bacterium]
MERKLFIIRHGKSSWDHEGLSDIDRPLAERGTRGAHTMAHRLVDKGLVPELVFTSPASRALNTALIMTTEWGLDPSLTKIHDELYMAYVSEIGEVVGEAPDEVAGLAIFGHNPSFTLFANTFLEEPLDNLPTAGVVVVTLETDSWKGLDRAHVKHTYVDFPKKRR